MDEYCVGKNVIEQIFFWDEYNKKSYKKFNGNGI